MSDETREFKKYDTHATTTYYVRLATDPKVFTRDRDGEDVRGGTSEEDVVLTFCDSSRFDTHEELWVDARVGRHQQEWAKKYRKGDEVVITGKLRFVLGKSDGKVRGKMFDVSVNSFVRLGEREAAVPRIVMSYE